MVTPPRFQADISLRADALTLKRGMRVLFDDLSFAVCAGELAELRGPNGSGKTSLLRALAGYLRPTAGRITVAAQEDPPLLMHVMGHLNALKGAASVQDHIIYWTGLLGAGAEQASAALAAVGLAKQAMLPARVLSQGQARRLALARLLVAPRPIWLLDEPAASLDEQGKDLLCTLIEAHLRDGGLAIMALHEPLRLTPAHVVSLA